METFLERTMPASSMAKPAAIHMTRKPPMRKRSVLRMNWTSLLTAATAVSATGSVVTTTASCARPTDGSARSAPAPINER